MSDFKGVLIEESLQDKKVLEGLSIAKTKVEHVTPEHKTPWLKQWTLHSFLVPAVKADQLAEQLRLSLDTKNGHWYVDFKNDKTHYIIFSDKLFIVDRSKRADYKAAFEHGLKLGIPHYQLIRYPDVALDALTSFLQAANKSTYANASAKKASSTLPGSHDYHFEQDDFVYHDTYFGSRDFIGQEIVYNAGRPVWGASYFGVVTDDNTDEDELYDFLRRALLQDAPGVIPVRGPKRFSENDWEYRFVASGDLTTFTGTEEIIRRGKKVYKLTIQGGFVG